LVTDPKTSGKSKPSDKRRINIDERRDVIILWMQKDIEKRGANITLSEVGDNFMRVCDKLGLPMHHRRLYDMWLGKYYGPSAPTAPTGALGVTYMSQWGGGSRKRHPLTIASKFPMP